MGSIFLLTAPMVWLQPCRCTRFFYIGAEDLNSDPHACIASTSPNVLSSQPSDKCSLHLYNTGTGDMLADSSQQQISVGTRWIVGSAAGSGYHRSNTAPWESYSFRQASILIGCSVNLYPPSNVPTMWMPKTTSFSRLVYLWACTGCLDMVL